MIIPYPLKNYPLTPKLEFNITPNLKKIFFQRRKNKRGYITQGEHHISWSKT